MWPPPQWGPNGQIVNVKRTADGRRQRGRKNINEEKEKYRAKNGSLRNTSTDSKVTTFVILINHRSAPIRKKRLSPTSKASREASRNKFGGAQKGSFWLCYAEPLAEKWKSGISGKRHRPKPIPWEKNSWVS